MAATMKNAISSGEYLQWGARKRMTWGVRKPHPNQTDKAMENKFAILFESADKEAAAVIIPCSSDEKIAVPCNNSSKPQNKANNIMYTRSRKYAKGTNTVQENDAWLLEPFVWPNVSVSLSRGEKEEDFLAMKGSKLPLRPKKRIKSVQKAIHNVTPGGWLSDICQERYEVGEKKCTNKRSRGLKVV